jgi:uncharacterized membrane protein
MEHNSMSQWARENQGKGLQWRSGLWAMLLLVGLGLCFRTAELAEKVYWVDEVTTSLRVAGYTKAEAIEQLADGQPRSVADLQRYQQLNPSKGWSDTLSALSRSPEHAPLYFLLARLWSHRFGSSIVAIRSLSVLLSLLALPCLYALAQELFGNPAIAQLATGLLAVSPFFVAYAQEARPYSLWLLLLLLNGLLLLRSLRQSTRLTWLGYTLSATLMLYTSLLSALVLLGQAVYVVWAWRHPVRWRSYALALGGAIGLFSPWLLVILHQWSRLQANTTWTQSSLGLLPMLPIWLYNISVLYFDVPIVTSPLWVGLLEVGTAIAVVSLMVYAINFLRRRTPRECWLFVVSLIATMPVCLIAADLLRGSQISTAARYLLPSHLGIQLAMAHLFAIKLTTPSVHRRNRWRWIVGLVITISCLSCLFQLHQPPKYQKSRNLHNQPIAAVLNQSTSAMLLAEASETLDVISLSYSLNPAVQVQILSDAASLPALPNCELFVLNPSPALQASLQTVPTIRFTPRYQPQRLVPTERVLSLWQVTPIDRTTCSQPAAKDSAAN